MLPGDMGQARFSALCDYQSFSGTCVCVRALKVLLGDKCQRNHRVNINYRIFKVRCLFSFIVAEMFIVTAARDDF